MEGMNAVKAQFRNSDKAKSGRISEDSLVDLIKKLCGDAISLEMIYALFHSYDGSDGPRGTISYDEFIEWLFQSLEAAGGAPNSIGAGLEMGTSPKAPQPDATAELPERSEFPVIPCASSRYKLFCSHQHTEEASRVRDLWLSSGECDSVKISTPPFNIRLNVPLPQGAVALNIATFGVKLPRVIMKLFQDTEVLEISRNFGIPIPKYAMDTFVQKKMPKVLDLVAEARKPELEFDDADLKAVDKLESFAKAFGKLDGKAMSGPEEFQTFVEQHVAPGWEDHLHFDSVLIKNFGFSESVSEKLRNSKIKVIEKDVESEVSLEHHALRWLTKAFKGYGPVGCLTDVVNLVYAMLNIPQPDKASEEAAMDAVSKFQEKMDQRQFDDLWIPTHLAHDAESDDSLSWLLLEHLHKLRGTRLEVLIQLPAEEKLNDVCDLLKNYKDKFVQVFRDQDSSNGKAVGGTWGPLATKYKEGKD